MPPKGPFPRTYDLEDTLHRKERTRVRQISWAEVEETVRTGSERPQPGIGRNKGRYVRFEKKIAGRIVVVIGEVLGNTCYILTTYEG